MTEDAAADRGGTSRRTARRTTRGTTTRGSAAGAAGSGRARGSARQGAPRPRRSSGRVGSSAGGSSRRGGSGGGSAAAAGNRSTGRGRSAGVRAAQQVVGADATSLRLPVLGPVRLPPLDQLAFFSGLALLTALQVVDWPVAVLVGAGHALSRARDSRTLQQFGLALEDA